MDRTTLAIGVAAVALVLGASVVLLKDEPANAVAAPPQRSGPALVTAAATQQPTTTYSELLAKGVAATSSTATATRHAIEDSKDILQAVLAARASGDADAMRLALSAARECLGVVRAKRQPSEIPVIPGLDASVRTQQLASLQALQSQCDGFSSLSLGDAKALTQSLADGAAKGDTPLAQLDAIADRSKTGSLSGADKALLFKALQSGDQVLVDRALYTIGSMLADASTPHDQRPSFSYMAPLAAAVGDVYGTPALKPATDLQYNEACVAGFACRGADGAVTDLQPGVASAELLRLQNAYGVALKGGSFDGLLKVH